MRVGGRTGGAEGDSFALAGRLSKRIRLLLSAAEHEMRIDAFLISAGALRALNGISKAMCVLF